MEHSIGMSKTHERDDPKAKHACDGWQSLEKDLTVEVSLLKGENRKENKGPGR